MLGLEYLVAGHLLLNASTAVSEPQKPKEWTCSVQKSARVDVRWRVLDIKYDLTKSTADLNHSEVDTTNPYGTHVAVDVGGLMSGNVKSGSDILISSENYRVGGVTCLWVDRVVVDITVDPTIFIANEHPQGTCEYNAIVEHEKKHVAADRAAVEGHLGNIRKAVADAVQKVGVVGPKPESKIDTYKAKMVEYIQGALAAEMDQLYVDRNARQATIDSKEEYDRVSALCPKAGAGVPAGLPVVTPGR